MNQLLDKFNEYKSIVNYRMEYIFENDSAISFKLKQTDFPNIEIRFNCFSRENILTMAYTDVIIDFDAALIGSNLKAKYILVEKKQQGYNHLCVAEDGIGKDMQNHSIIYQ